MLDGINDGGLAVSLAFGGRKLLGNGFGIPLILRYVLEFCDDVTTATEVLERIPTHMPYNVTVVDREGAFATLYLCPGYPAGVTDSRTCTNHQQRVEREDYARMTSTVERREFLEARLADSAETRDRFIGRFLRPPLYNTLYEQAFGTLYTAAYFPVELAAEYRWPRQSAHANRSRTSGRASERSTSGYGQRPAGACFRTKRVS